MKNLAGSAQVEIEHRVVAHVTIDIPNDKGYLICEMIFPDGSFRKFYVSKKVLNGPVEMAEPSDSEIYG